MLKLDLQGRYVFNLRDGAAVLDEKMLIQTFISVHAFGECREDFLNAFRWKKALIEIIPPGPEI